MNTYFSKPFHRSLGGALQPRGLRAETSFPYWDAVVLGLGLVILANSRPYEGLILSLTVAVAMLRWLLRPNRLRPTTPLKSAVLPIAAILAFGAVATGYYNYRVTGSPLLMPLELNREVYAPARYFIWQSPRPEPFYRHAVMSGLRGSVSILPGRAHGFGLPSPSGAKVRLFGSSSWVRLDHSIISHSLGHAGPQNALSVACRRRISLRTRGRNLFIPALFCPATGLGNPDHPAQVMVSYEIWKYWRESQ